MRLIDQTTLTLSLCFVLFCFACSLSAQVTIGSDVDPETGALVDLKNRKSEPDNTNADGGLLIARLQLTNLTEIPFLPANLSSDDLKKLKALHIGHLVYNTYEGGTIKKGLYCWDGEEWRPSLVGDISVDGPWYKINTSNQQSINNNDDSYINAKIVIGGDAIANLDASQKASLTVLGSDASVNDVSFGTGWNPNLTDQNIAAGKYSLIKNNTGKNNTALGYEALSKNISGNNNIAVGAQALNSLTSGSSNTAIGYNAGNNITTGTKNLTIGANTQVPNPTGTEQINIGNALFGKENSIVIGKTVPYSDSTSALDVYSTWKIDDLEEQENADILVVDNDGFISRSKVAPVIHLHINSVKEQNMSNHILFADTAASAYVPIIWDSDEVPYNNNVLKLNSDGESFTVLREFVCQISGFINYNPNAQYSTSFSYSRDNASVLLNIGLQAKKKGASAWEIITITRGVWAQGEVDNSIQTITIPQIIHTFNVGDQIRMIAKRPVSVDKKFLGKEHGKGAGNPSKIMKGNTVLYSKGLRIVGL